MIRIALLDDHAVTRAGFEAILAPERDLVFVGAAADEDELWPLLRRARPDLVVLDIDHPGRNGLSLSLVLKRQIAPPRVVVHSSLSPAQLLVPARLAGVDAVIAKADTRRHLLETLRAAAQGAAPAEIPAAARAHVAAQLGATDRAILAMVLAGTAERDIATTIGISPGRLGRRLYAIVMRLTPSAGEARDRTRLPIPLTRGAPVSDAPMLRGTATGAAALLAGSAAD